MGPLKQWRQRKAKLRGSPCRTTGPAQVAGGKGASVQSCHKLEYVRTRPSRLDALNKCLLCLAGLIAHAGITCPALTGICHRSRYDRRSFRMSRKLSQNISFIGWQPSPGLLHKKTTAEKAALKLQVRRLFWRCFWNGVALRPGAELGIPRQTSLQR